MEMKFNDTYFVLDTETGGLNPQEHSLMEIAGVIVKGDKIIYEYSTLVKSRNGKYSCGEYARKLHGISDTDCEEQGKYPHEIIKNLLEIKRIFFGDSPMTIVAHNTAFDISFVKEMFNKEFGSLRNKPIYEKLKSIDYDALFARNAIDTATMALILRSFNKLPFDRCSLDNILKFYNLEVPQEKRHTALGDARQTALAFIAMREDLRLGDKHDTHTRFIDENTVFNNSAGDSDENLIYDSHIKER